MRKFRKVQPLVYDALTRKPETRKDDFLLVLEVFKHFITGDMELETVLRKHKELGVPSFSSITRTRRKLQKMHPELVDGETAIMRGSAEKEYREYARI